MSNRLAQEESPYLQQHINNPVHWYGWCNEAFERAKSENRGIFISIGYSSCHWCHVMEHEVFENEKIAEILNEYFICVKVDREERPDIDKHYQEVHQLINQRSGGWPLSMFCTPENKPFYSGTYIPPESYANVLGFRELVTILSEKIGSKDEKLFNNANEIEKFLKVPSHPKEATKLHEQIGTRFLTGVHNYYDEKNGGFSVAPKFPQTSTLNMLLNLYLIYDNQEAKKMLEHTLHVMAKGGMYDIVDGGFCRYSTDDSYLVPHFEKMCYDNGLLIEIYSRAYKHLKDERYLEVASQSADFMEKFMSENSLYYSASDADSDGAEGTYFVYDYDETFEYLKAQNIEESYISEALKALSITKSGNFEGNSIARFTCKEKYEDVLAHLKVMRQSRAYPFIDKKVITSCNAMMVKGVLELSNSEKSYKDDAIKTLHVLLEKMYKNDILYHSMLINSQPKIEAFLEDYAYLGVALIKAYETTFDEYYLIIAQKLANRALEKFYESGRWYFSKGDFETLEGISDGTFPSSISVMVDLLLSLSIHIDIKYKHFAFKTLEYNSLKLMKSPSNAPYLSNMALRYIKEDRVVKSTQENLEKIESIKYPYTTLHVSKDSDYMICGDSSCF
ncbi:MAG: thioredoxin domain-containing protein, partial [Campylobacterota bacterium]|nr:thioredoxin domain-containing protein [Campylobacterota bacterium]